MASLSSVVASSCSLHKHHHQSKHQFSSSSHTALKSTKNFIVSHTSYEQRIDPSLPLCCAINSIQTTVTTNFSYREVFPSAILPTLCCEPDNSSSSDLTAAATTEEDDDIFYYYATSDLPGTVGGKELLYREEEGGDNSGSSSHKLDRKHNISSPVRSYLLIESMGSGSSTTAAGAAASNRSRSTNVGISASHGNILTKPPKSSKHHIRRSSFSSDNGGFDIIPTPTSAASKSSHMGVRERLRSSLDKISFKPAFRWGSSDKIQSNFNNGGSSQSKSKNKTSRRSADSPRVRTVAATPEPQSAAIKQQHKHRSRNVESACSELERIGDIMCKSAAAAEQQHNNHHHQQHISKNGGQQQQHLLRQHRVTNHHHHQQQQHHHHNNTTGGGECERGSSNLPDYVGIPSSHHTSASNSVANSVMNINKASVDDRKRLAVAGNESYQAIAFDYAETLKTNREAITRAKGTWSMLRTNNNPQTRYRPVKASTGVLNPIVISGSMDVLPSSETMHSIASDLRRKRITTEKSSLAAHNTTSPPTKQQDVCTEEPPKIMPVSGKLLQQYVETTILRPTAFKVVPRRQESPHQAPAPQPPPAAVVAAIHESRSSDVIIMSNDHHSQAHQESRSALSSRKSCASDSNSDSGLLCSGRNSSNSLPAVAGASTGVGELVANTSSNTSSGGNVSCSASSEGYDSAGVPHNNNQTEINCADASPLVLHKFANGESLQIHDVDDDDDVELQTANHRRHDDGDNTSENDEYTMMTNGNDGKDVVGYHRDSKHVINDKYDDTPHYSNGSTTQQQQQRYNNDPMLPATTIDLTSVIRPSSSEATLHIITQQQQHKAQHQHVTLDLRSRLNDYEREMQQRRAEISQLKGQAKDLQGELSHRTTEIVTLRSRNRSLFARVAARDRQLADTMSRLDDREATCSELQRRLHEDDAVSSASLARDRRCHVTSSAWPSERDALLKRLGEVEERYMEQSRQFEVERQQWIVDKTRVVRYQKQLQDNYMHLYKRSRDLEQENNVLANKLRHLTMTSASTSSSSMMGGGEKRLMNGVGDVTSSTTTQALSYPMDI